LITRVLSPLSALLLCAGCLYQSSRNEPYRPPEETPRTFQVLRKRDPETGVVVREWTAFLEPGERAVKHGRELLRYPSGAAFWERFYDHGRPSGEWTSWYEDGARRSHAVYAGPEEPREMSFWHPGGALSARGPARDGVREGEWTFWHANGALAARGRFERAMREGEWSFWSEDGALRERALYSANRRVSGTRGGAPATDASVPDVPPDALPDAGDPPEE
jgi:hypothetical protein